MIAIGVIILIIIAWPIFIYNGFISLRTRAEGAWSDIDVQLKRRHDLVPNLVSVVQGYAAHEKATLEDIARLRSQASQENTIAGKEESEVKLSGAIKSLFAIAESYPELRADANFRDLQHQLTEIEDNIQYARRYYNAVVRDLNIKRDSFPSNLIGSLFNIERLPYFQVNEDEKNPVDIKMGGGSK